MARYFFHVKDGQDLPDDLGSDLSGIDAVRNHAVKTAGEMLRDGGGGGFLVWAPLDDDRGR
jgi:hypothetical protein